MFELNSTLTIFISSIKSKLVIGFATDTISSFSNWNLLIRSSIIFGFIIGSSPCTLITKSYFSLSDCNASLHLSVPEICLLLVKINSPSNDFTCSAIL